MIALGLAIWVFVFLYFTEPLDVNEFNATEKLIYLPLYGILTAIIYIVLLPVQQWLYHKSGLWRLRDELLVLILFIGIAVVVMRFYYLQFIVHWHPNAYSLWFHFRAILAPAMLTILPVLLIGRFGFGKYKEKQLEDQKIEIKGEGHYEGLRLQQQDLISIQSSDNYIEVFYLDGHVLKKTLIRNKLSVIADTFPDLLRTHRSYVINPYHFQSWKTEKGKPIIHLSHQIEVPISKTYLEQSKLVLGL